VKPAPSVAIPTRPIPKFATALAAMLCELRVRGTRSLSDFELESDPGFDFVAFSAENRCPSRIKSGAGFFRKMR
jgi:hypothetical protein